jgi:excisionase family DNA binding protein
VTSAGAAPEPTAYLTPEQVAEMLQLSVKSVYRIAKDPTFPALKIGGSVRFPRERLLRWLRDREQGRPPRRAVRLKLRAVRPTDRPARGVEEAGRL